jgi:hypothetical protein
VHVDSVGKAAPGTISGRALHARHDLHAALPEYFSVYKK